AAATQWKSPLKWRLISSIGSTIALPPPVPPPFTPNTGPIDGSRRQSITFLSMRPSPCVSATLVVVLPSPALVGVIAVTMTSLPSALPASRRSSDSFTLARNSPYVSSSSGWMPAFAAISAIGRSCTWDDSDTTLIDVLSRLIGTPKGGPTNNFCELFQAFTHRARSFGHGAELVKRDVARQVNQAAIGVDHQTLGRNDA